MTFSVTHDATSDMSPVYSPTFDCTECDTVGYLDGDTNSNGILEYGETWVFETSRSTDGSTPDPLSLAGDAAGLDGDGENVAADATHDIDIVEPGTVAGNVFEDLNGNGVLDAGEPGIDDADVTLTQGGSDIATRTPTGGAYLFDHLFPGEFTVIVDESALPAGLSPTNTAGPASLVEGGAVTGVDFGYAYPATVTGVVFEDNDFDGTAGVGEDGIGSVTVSLLDSDGVVVDSTATDADGSYSFTTLPGEYSIAVGGGTPQGWDFTTPQVVSLGLIVSGSANDVTPIGLANQAPELLEASQSIYLNETPTTLPWSDPEGSDVLFSIVDGQLPVGVTLGAGGGFAGAADEIGVFNLQIELCDTGNPSACAVYEWQLNVSEPPPSVAGVEALPFTGAESGPLAAVGILMLVAGAGVVFSSRIQTEG